MKKLFILLIALLFTSITLGQEIENQARITKIEHQLELLLPEIPGLSEQLNIKAQRTALTTFLISVSEIHKVNIDASLELSNIEVNNSFKNVIVKDVIVYLCKIYELDIDFTGSILYFKPYKKKIEEPTEKIIPISYNPLDDTFSIDLKDTNLPKVFKSISAKTGKGLFYSQDLATISLSGYINKLPFDIAMEKLAFSNNLILTKTKDGLYEFENGQINTSSSQKNSPNRPSRSRRSNFFFNVVNQEKKLLEVDFSNVAISDIIYDLSNALQLDVFSGTPLDNAGIATVKAKEISFDKLLTKIFENQERTVTSSSGLNVQNNQPTNGENKRYTWRKDDNVYYFGTYDQFTLRSSQLVQLQNRSVVILTDPETGTRQAGRTVSIDPTFGNSGITSFNQGSNRNQQDNTTSRNQNRESNSNSNTNLKDIIPLDIQRDLDITIDEELNGFIVSGPSSNIERFKEFVLQIDKKVPLVVIEVMILETNKNSSIDLGVEWGIGTAPTTTQGQIFPSTDLNLGANTVNRILGRIDGSSFFNIGKVVPNFYANIRASESNGNFEIKDSPRITTLNGHRASFSNGQTSYYAVTSQTFIGTQTPATSEIVNYQPIDAELSLEVKPFVSLDGEITMDLRVIQSNFNGERIADDAPPGINSRELTSIVRARSNDIIVLGGLESSSRSDSGSGVPFLARIPIIKYLFSKRTRSTSKSKLSILIKPTIFY